MVATKGKGWVLAPSAHRAVQEADAIAPHRSRASDGSIGDAAHASRSSFHNPWEGFVDAVDITHDPLGGFDAHAHADELVASQPEWLDHVISNRRIASAAKGWVWRPYTGANPHDKHIHVANLRDSKGRNYAGPIFDTEDDMGLTAGEQKQITAMDDRLAKVDTNISDIHRRTAAIEKRLDQIALGGVDEDALAVKVADLLAKRLKD